MASTADLLIRIRADSTQAMAQLASLRGEMDAFVKKNASATQVSAFKNVETLSRAALPASAALAGTGGGILAGLGDALAQAASFDTMLVETRNNTTMTTADIDEMRSTLLRLSAEGGASLKSLAVGFRQITDLGFSAKDAGGILEVAMQSAVGTGADTGQVADALATTMKQFGQKNPAQAKQTMDMLHTAATQGKMTLDQFTGNFGQAGSIAGAVGIPMDEAIAAYATLSRFMDPAQAATQFKGIVAHMAIPTKESLKELQSLSAKSGIDLTNAFSPAELQAKGLPGVIDEVNEAMRRAGLTTAEQEAEWGNLVNAQRGGIGAMLLAGTGAEDYRKVLQSVRASTDVTVEGFERMKQTAGGQWNILGAQAQQVGMSMVNGMLPALKGTLEGLNNFVAAIRSLPAPVLSTIAIIAGAAGAVLALAGTLGLVAFAAGPLISGFTALGGLARIATGALIEMAGGAGVLATAETGAGVAAAGAAPRLSAFGTAAAGALPGLLAFAAAAALIAQGQSQISEGGKLDAFSKSLPADQSATIDRRTKELVDQANKATGGYGLGNSESVRIAAREQAMREQGINVSDVLATAQAPESNPVQSAIDKVIADARAAQERAKAELTPYEPPEIVEAKAAVENAQSNAQGMEVASAQRKADFAVAHLNAEQQALSLKIQQTESERELLGYKQQIEDIDRAAVDYAQQLRSLDEQDAITKARIASNPAANRLADIKYQEEELKARLAAARAGGAPVDVASARQQLTDLHKQELQVQPEVLRGQHEVDLANRAKEGDDLQQSLKNSATARAKIGVQQQMQPLEDEVRARTRAAEAAQAALDLDRQRYELSEKAYEVESLLAQVQQKVAEKTLNMLKHPTSDMYGPPSPTPGVTVNGDTIVPAGARPANVLGAVGEPVYSAVGGPESEIPREAALAERGAPQAGAGVTVHVGDIHVAHDGDHEGMFDSILQAVAQQLQAAWTAATAHRPATGQLGGNYAGIAAR